MVTRRQFCAAPAFARALAGSRPRVLLLMSGQHRGDWMGCAGQPAIGTPNLDWLAASGVRFQNAFSSTPACTPARAAVLLTQHLAPCGEEWVRNGRLVPRPGSRLYSPFCPAPAPAG